MLHDTLLNHKNEIVHYLKPEQKRAVPGKHGKFVFFAYGCALLERRTDSGMYVYTAANLNTGQVWIISRRTIQLAGSGFEGMAAKICQSEVSGGSRFLAEKVAGLQERKSDVASKPVKQTLGQIIGHIFTEILPKHGYGLREKQLELARHILEVIQKRGVTLAESEVGTGKTHAYLVASLLARRSRLNDTWLHGHYVGGMSPLEGSKRKKAGRGSNLPKPSRMPVVISTSSIALQQAIVSDYIPELSNILTSHGVIRKPLVAFIRKGKEHYACELRLERFYQRSDEEVQKLLMPYRGLDKPFDLTNAKGLTPYMKRSICVSGRCDENCPMLRACRYTDYINMANGSDVDFQITNHNYFLADRLHRISGKRPLFPDYQLVIIDEAHKFLQAARSMFGLELTDREIPALAHDIHSFTGEKSGSGVNVHKLAKKLEGQSSKLFKRLKDNIPADGQGLDDEAERFPVVIDLDVSRHLTGIENIATDIGVAAKDSPVIKRKKETRLKALWKLSSVAERAAGLREKSRNIYWLENRAEGETEIQALCAIPKDLDARLFHGLWSSGIPIVLTSGTLSAGVREHAVKAVPSNNLIPAVVGTTSHSADFTRAKETLGLDRLPANRLFSTTMPSPFDYYNNARLDISEKVPFPDNQAAWPSSSRSERPGKDRHYITAVAGEIENLVRASHGHAAVLFTSYNVMGQVHAILRSRRLPFPLFRLERGSTHAIEQFKKSGNGILLASGALWEGIDIPGDALSMLIIVKLPFAVPDPIGDYERELCGDMETYKAKAVVPDMLVKLKQGFGRLIRKESDTGVVAILDCRAGRQGAYRRKVLASLPSLCVIDSVKDIEAFLRSKKPEGYFVLPGDGLDNINI